MTLATSILLLGLFPETQYTKSTTVNKHERKFTDNFRFWCVSGGGNPKVHRFAWPSNTVNRNVGGLTFLSFTTAFLYPFRYIVHPVVIINTTFFSLYLVTTNYLLVSDPLRPSIILKLTLWTRRLDRYLFCRYTASPSVLVA